MTIFPSWTLTYTENLMTYWATRLITNPHTLTSTPIPTTILQTNKPHFPHWCTGLDLFVTRKACRVNCTHSEPFSGITASDWQIQHTLKPQARVASPPERPALVAFLPYVKTTFNRIRRLLSRQNIKLAGLPPKKIPSFLWSIQ